MTYAKDFHAAVAAVLVKGTQKQTIMLINDSMNPPLWKFPGGGGENGETPYETAAREHEEETGIPLDPSKLILVTNLDVKADGKRIRNDHTKYFFITFVDSFDGLVRIGDDGERTGKFDLSEIDRMVDIHPTYYRFYQEAKKAGLL